MDPFCASHLMNKTCQLMQFSSPEYFSYVSGIGIL